MEEIEQLHDDWNEKTESMLLKWKTEYREQYKHHKKIGARFRWSHKILLLFVMITSTIMGSNGLITNFNSDNDDNTSKTINLVQSTVMIIISVITTILQYFKFEKRAHRQSTLSSSYKTIAKKIQIQLALPRESRQNFLQFVQKIETKRQNLEKCYSVNMETTPLLQQGPNNVETYSTV